MGKTLSDLQVQQYEKDGYLHPNPALTDDEVSTARTEIEKFEARTGKPKIISRNQSPIYCSIGLTVLSVMPRY